VVNFLFDCIEKAAVLDIGERNEVKALPFKTFKQKNHSAKSQFKKSHLKWLLNLHVSMYTDGTGSCSQTCPCHWRDANWERAKPDSLPKFFCKYKSVK
jgi:hypothetical protein